MDKKIKILFTGGGTAGSVTPLLAIAEEFEGSEFLWVGTKQGPEGVFVEDAGITFKTIFWGKLRRYFHWRNFVDPFFVMVGFFESLFILLKFKPDIVFGAGSFVQVPVVVVAWLLRIPVVVHQLDIQVGLANRICALFATKITVSFEEIKEKLEIRNRKIRDKIVYVGTPIREEVLRHRTKIEACNRLPFDLNTDKSIVLIMGGGAGSEILNKVVLEQLDELTTNAQIIHVTGKDKKFCHSGAERSGAIESSERGSEIHSRDPIVTLQDDINGYFQVELLTTSQVANAYWVADMVVTRAGMGTLTELAALSKPAIVIPLETGNTQQVKNAEYFTERGAVKFIRERDCDSLSSEFGDLISNKKRLENYSQNISKLHKRDVLDRVIELVEGLTDERLFNN